MPEWPPFDEPCDDGHIPSEWLIQQRKIGAGSKHVLNQAHAECLRMATTDGLNEDDALGWLLLATVAADVESRGQVAKVIRRGLEAMDRAWSSCAGKVALGEMTQEAADVVVADQVASTLRDAILHADWPHILNVNEIAAMSTLARWHAEDAQDD
jgi:hypothetical protein